MSPARAHPIDLLHITDRSLKTIIDEQLGEPPSLEVVAQWLAVQPLPTWVAPPLSTDGVMLTRCTGYRAAGIPLSHNLAYVDLGRVPADVAEDLKSERLNLGDFFTNGEIRKCDYVFGAHTDHPEFAEEFQRRLDGRFDPLTPYVWRRYSAVLNDTVICVVIEALPCAVWEQLLAAQIAPVPLIEVST